MIIYLISFLISALFIYAADKSNDENKRKIYSIIGIMIPCILSGVRAETIGTDVNVYVRPLFDMAEEATSFFDFINMKLRWFYVYKMEIGFTLMLYIITKLTHSMVILLTVISALIIVPIYKGVLYWRNKVNPAFVMLIFYFSFFNTTLNVMRQFIAIAIIFYGTKYLYEEKLLKYFICIVVSILFHKSGILGILLLLMYQYMHKTNKFEKKYILDKDYLDPDLVKIGCVLVLSMLVLFSSRSFEGIFKVLHMEYYYKSYLHGVMHLSYRQILAKIPIIVLIIMNWKAMKTNNKQAGFLILLFVSDMIFSQMHSISKQSGRIALYFGIYNIITYSILCKSAQNKKMERVIKILLMLYIALYWYYKFVYRGEAETYPYMSVFGI